MIKISNSIPAFKKYFASLGFNFGDVNDPTATPEFIQAVQSIERRLSTILLKVAPSSAPNAFVGMIWQNGNINPTTSPEDVEQALMLLFRKLNELEAAKMQKAAQATVDTFDVEEYQTGQASPLKLPSRDDTGGQVGDPLDSQQIGLFRQIAPQQPNSADDGDEDEEKEKAEKKALLLRRRQFVRFAGQFL